MCELKGNSAEKFNVTETFVLRQTWHPAELFRLFLFSFVFSFRLFLAVEPQFYQLMLKFWAKMFMLTKSLYCIMIQPTLEFLFEINHKLVCHYDHWHGWCQVKSRMGAYTEAARCGTDPVLDTVETYQLGAAKRLGVVLSDLSTRRYFSWYTWFMSTQIYVSRNEYWLHTDTVWSARTV